MEWTLVNAFAVACFILNHATAFLLTNSPSQIMSAHSNLSRQRRQLGPPPILPPLPSSPIECYFCRSDRQSNCMKSPDYFSIQQCNNATLQAFVDDLINNPPKKPLPIYTSRSLAALTEWACFTQISSDGTFALRSCAVVESTRQNGCNPCSFAGHTAKCCICRDSACNNSRAISFHRYYCFSFIEVLTIVISVYTIVY